MPTFTFQLEAVLRYRRNVRDLRRQVLAQVFEAQQTLVHERQNLHRRREQQIAQIREYAGPGEVDIDRTASRRYFTGQLTMQLALNDRNRQLVARQVELCRKQLIEANRDVKVLEELKDRRYAEHIYRQEQIERRELEEGWQAAQSTEAPP